MTLLKKKNIIVLPIVILLFLNPNNSRLFSQETQPLGMKVEAGFGVKILDYLNAQILFSPYYNVTNNLQSGIGFGYINYDNSLFSHSFPVFVHTDYLFGGNSQKIRFFLGAKIGYGIIHKNRDIIDMKGLGTTKIRGGSFLSPSLGIRYNLKNKKNLSLSLSCDFQKSKMNNYYSAGTLSHSTDDRFFSFRVGYVM